MELEFTWEGLDEAIDRLVQEQIEPVLRGLSVELWNDNLERTPQFFGRLVASWSYTVGEPLFTDRSDLITFVKDAEAPGKTRARQKGDPEGISIANLNSRGKDLGFRLGQTIWMANGADHGQGAYSTEIEETDPSNLREVNRPGHALAYAVAAIEAKYGQEITGSQALKLKNLHIL